MNTLAGTKQPSRNPWLITPLPRPVASLRLVCFPYAGGSAGVYRTWARLLPDEVELVLVQLPGRANRLAETPIRRLPALLDALDQALGRIYMEPYAFFGHSMGALVAYELTRRLQASCRPLPRDLFVSGRAAPGIAERRAPIHDLSRAELVSELRKYGRPPAAFADEDLLDLALPALRADFELIDASVHVPGPPLDVPLTAFGGVDDPWVRPADVAAWSSETSRPFAHRSFPGQHFFIHDAEAEVVAAIAFTLSAQRASAWP